MQTRPWRRVQTGRLSPVRDQMESRASLSRIEVSAFGENLRALPGREASLPPAAEVCSALMKGGRAWPWDLPTAPWTFGSTDRIRGAAPRSPGLKFIGAARGLLAVGERMLQLYLYLCPSEAGWRRKLPKPGKSRLGRTARCDEGAAAR